MAYTTFEIKKYQYAMFSSGDGGTKVTLFDIGGVNIATAYFRPDSESLPGAYLDSRGIYRLYFRRSTLSDFIDLIRNESPVYLHFWNESGNNTHISTGREPVGDGETI